jgi:hypothetical protein
MVYTCATYPGNYPPDFLIILLCLREKRFFNNSPKLPKAWFRVGSPKLPGSVESRLALVTPIPLAAMVRTFT